MAVAEAAVGGAAGPAVSKAAVDELVAFDHAVDELVAFDHAVDELVAFDHAIMRC